MTEDNPVRVIDVFIDELDLGVLGSAGVVPHARRRPAYHPAMLPKIELYGYLDRIQPSLRLERESQRKIELMWQTGWPMPDFKTMADFRRDNGPAIRAAWAHFVAHEMTNAGRGRAYLTCMGSKARDATGCMEVTVLTTAETTLIITTTSRPARLALSNPDARPTR